MEIKEAIKIIKGLIRIAELGYNSNPLSKEGEHTTTEALTIAISALEKQEQAENEWCTDCKEYDQGRHCCHRFTKVIRQAVEEYRRTRHEI